MSLLIEIIEWVDQTGQEMVYRIPQTGSADFKVGAQLIVRDSQQAIFFKDGKPADQFLAGRHTLTSMNIPILTRLLSFPFGFTSPFRAEVYFINRKLFADVKWGTRHPVVFKDAKLGLVRLRAHGTMAIRIEDPVIFLNTIVGRQSLYSTADIKEYLRDIVIARLNDMLGERLQTILDLPAQYTEFAGEFKKIAGIEFQRLGLELSDMYIASITPPDEVSALIDQRSGMEAVGDLDKFMKFQMAQGIGNTSGAGQTGAATGMAAAVGMMMPGVIGQALQPSEESGKVVVCGRKDCPAQGNPSAKFCAECGKAIARDDNDNS